jgi:lichenan operon transcriptional antiterminator
MESWKLSFRARKLLHYLYNQETYTSGDKLANYLHVSSRTIRNDINNINKTLKDFEIKIVSKASTGYRLERKNTEILKKLQLSNGIFLSREDSIRHIVFRLLLADKPIDLYDLVEEEMGLSLPTIVGYFKSINKYFPRLQNVIYRNKNSVFLKIDERNRRSILNQLFTETWNYDGRGNAYYQYHYVNEKTVNLVRNEVNYQLMQHRILLEDVNMVVLILMITIMFYRVSNNHELKEIFPFFCHDKTVIKAVDSILDSLSEKLSCKISSTERGDIYMQVACSRLLEYQYNDCKPPEALCHFFPWDDEVVLTKSKRTSIKSIADKNVIHAANEYIRLIKDVFSLDLQEHNDFYAKILIYFRYLSLPVHHLNYTEINLDTARLNLFIEFEIACLFQPIALQCFGRTLDIYEIFYLALCINNALIYKGRARPKLKTIIMCQYNSPLVWNLKEKILDVFMKNIDIIALLPVYTKDNCDFTDVDLIITTSNKTISDDQKCDTLFISPLFSSADEAKIGAYIAEKQERWLYSSSLPSLQELLSEAFWHKGVNCKDNLSVIKLLAEDFISKKMVSADYLLNIQEREAIQSFSVMPDIAIVYSLMPSSKTCLSIAALDKPIKWGIYKISIAIMAAMHPEDTTLIFRLFNVDIHSRLIQNELP